VYLSASGTSDITHAITVKPGTIANKVVKVSAAAVF
jgi:hypothetical protein